jgi:glycosyltransferase involved in cell wall biosynthesis
MKTLVMMPTYNEISGLEDSVRSLFEHNQDVDLLIIDDNSPDGTGLLAEKLRSDSRVHVLHRTNKEGLGKAYLAGYDWGLGRGYDLLVQMDADGSHRPQDLPKLLNAKADLVIGSRWIQGGAVANWPKHRELISRAGNLYARVATGLGIGDLTAGFRVYRADALRKLNLNHIEAQGYGFQVEMTLRSKKAGLEVVEVPILFVERAQGASKMTKEIVFEAFWLCTKWGFRRLAKR